MKNIIIGLVLILFAFMLTKQAPARIEEPVISKAKINVAKSTDQLTIDTLYLTCVQVAANPTDPAPLAKCEEERKKASEGLAQKYK